MAEGTCVNSEASQRDQITIVVTDNHRSPGQIVLQFIKALNVGRSLEWALPNS